MPRSIAKSRLEALLSIATGAAAEPLAGLAGLYGAARGGSGEGVRMIDKVRGKLTYQPRDPRGQQEIASALGPLMQKIEAGKSWLGDTAYNASGSPALGAAAYTAPEALLSLLGARPALAAGRSASKGIGALVERSTRLPAPSIGSPASQLGIFAGRNAKTADHGAMQRAAARLARGDDPRAVWREEGWMKGPDGHMRFEIDDSKSSADFRDGLDEYRAAGVDVTKKPTALDGIYSHPELYSAYPDAANVGMLAFPRERMRGGTGAYSSKHNIITMADDISDAKAREYIGHEAQHYVQSNEGFARGGTPGSAVEAARAQEFNTDIYTPHDLYERLAGEAEARAVQKRLDYTPQQRRAIYPLDDYDVPLDELIFRGQSDGPQMNVGGYGGNHRPPMRSSGAPLHDVTGGGTVYPDDVYSRQAAQFYGTGDPALDAATMRLVQSFRNNPDAMVPIYRAVGPDVPADAAINPGDWVTINRAYADQHGYGLGDGYRILESRVPARDIYTNGDSIHEWGYDPNE